MWGQPTLSTGGCRLAHPSAESLCHPARAAVDRHGNLWVTDWYNSRVLMYPFDRSTGRPARAARRVLGQYDDLGARGCNRPPPTSEFASAPSRYTLCMPDGLAFDSHGALYVADQLNNRVLVYLHPNSAPAKGRALAADLVLGQSTFASVTPNGTVAGGDTASACLAPAPASACSLYDPEGLTVDASDDLLVADTLNNRVLMWDAGTLDRIRVHNCLIPCFIPAARVWGQHGSFTTACPNQPASGGAGCKPSYQVDRPGPETLYGPEAVLTDRRGDMLVADSANNRVLEYDRAVATGAQRATLVYGQSGQFDIGRANNGASGTTSLSAPSGLALDPSGHLWVSDQGNNRVLEFPAPNSSSVASDGALAQLGRNGDIAGSPPAAGSTTLDRPNSITFDTAGNAYVTERGDTDRVLEYVGLF